MKTKQTKLALTNQPMRGLLNADLIGRHIWLKEWVYMAIQRQMGYDSYDFDNTFILNQVKVTIANKQAIL